MKWPRVVKGESLAIQAGIPSPVLLDTSKISIPGFNVSTRFLMASMSKSNMLMVKGTGKLFVGAVGVGNSTHLILSKKSFANDCFPEDTFLGIIVGLRVLSLSFYLVSVGDPI